MTLLKQLLPFIFLCILLVSCEKEPQEPKITLGSKSVYTEFNPVALSKSCPDAQVVRVIIPASHYFIAPPGTVDTSFQILKVVVEGMEAQEFKVSNDFSYLNEEGKKKHKSKKFFDFEIPSHQVIGQQKGSIKIELYSKGKLVDDYNSQFIFLEEGEKLRVAEKTGFTSTRGDREAVRDPLYNFRIKEAGAYPDDILYSYRVQKEKDHYLVTTKALGGNIYKLDKAKNKSLVTKIPESNFHMTMVPLEMQLEEKDVKEGRLGTTYLKKEDVGGIPGYVYYEETYGMLHHVSFNNCQKTITEIEEILLPNISGWGPIQK